MARAAPGQAEGERSPVECPQWVESSQSRLTAIDPYLTLEWVFFMVARYLDNLVMPLRSPRSITEQWPQSRRGGPNVKAFIQFIGELFT